LKFRPAGMPRCREYGMQTDQEPFIAPLDNFLPLAGTERLNRTVRRPDELPKRAIPQPRPITGENLFWSRSGSHVHWSVDLDAVVPAIADEWRLRMPDRLLVSCVSIFSINP